MWTKVQKCLRFCGQETLAMIVCQQMRDPTEHYASSAKMLLDSDGHTLDACSACFPAVMSVEVAEFINGIFDLLII
uniref:INTS8 TPR repeats domain-containing protein n=1 Tax=Syphacia muris TaxID=451379 RepID=A0A0N5B094_9BILA